MGRGLGLGLGQGVGRRVISHGESAGPMAADGPDRVKTKIFFLPGPEPGRPGEGVVIHTPGSDLEN